MTINFENLEDVTRKYMRSEVNLDIGTDKIYYSRYLKDGLHENWHALLLESINGNDDAWLENQIKVNHMLIENYQKRTPSGGVTTAKVPHTAPQTLAEGEFNRFYCRALCARAIDEKKKVEVYRGKLVAHSRSASDDMIGRVVEPEVLLNDLRINIGVDTALGLPAGPNSGLTIKLV
ncbi:hypothetical protein ACQKC1_16865 [Shewanella baltica]|uniref:hypothetical protein n=1 Tax=Shewanella baltica TaxID=62322 RepID=UPI003D08F473